MDAVRGTGGRKPPKSLWLVGELTRNLVRRLPSDRPLYQPVGGHERQVVEVVQGALPPIPDVSRLSQVAPEWLARWGLALLQKVEREDTVVFRGWGQRRPKSCDDVGWHVDGAALRDHSAATRRRAILHVTAHGLEKLQDALKTQRQKVGFPQPQQGHRDRQQRLRTRAQTVGHAGVATANNRVPKQKNDGQGEAVDEEREEPLMQVRFVLDALLHEVVSQLGEGIRQQLVEAPHVPTQQEEIQSVETAQPALFHEADERPKDVFLHLRRQRTNELAAMRHQKEQPSNEVHPLAIAHVRVKIRVRVQHACQAILVFRSERWHLGECPRDIKLDLPRPLVVRVHEPPVDPGDRLVADPDGGLPNLPAELHGDSAPCAAAKGLWLLGDEGADALLHHIFPPLLATLSCANTSASLRLASAHGGENAAVP
mmetsp:Transcript_48814/g.136645  ORF Transcript_48814/g.136645 Transcript_48814/m.136645 type:complete len:427 (+) Transcript_48814:142-1422(+)